tara:strand:- start:303 stop:530 length:228 start_codon:yes stop_codon:yes gene_type:complete
MLVHPAGFEPATFWFVARCSIQLSYGCMVEVLGLEPRREESESSMLPITSYLKKWWDRWDLNPRPALYKNATLTY